MAMRRIGACKAYAIVRLDWSDRAKDFELQGFGPAISLGPLDVTIKEVVLDQDEAERAVERLNRLNESKGCRYFWQGTRLFAEGA
jgi:hypothetical protein